MNSRFQFRSSRRSLALGPIDNVSANWPLIEAALDKREVYSPFSAIAAIGTIAVETRISIRSASAAAGPISRTFTKTGDLGNVSPGDGAKFCSRGFIQLAGRRLYAQVGSEIGQDLDNVPS